MRNPRGLPRVAALGLAAALLVGCESGPIGPQDTIFPSGPSFTFTGTPQGCTPGFWKNPRHFDSWVTYSPTDSFNEVFGLPGTEWFPDSLTLLDALKLGGGGVNALARHAVAALLNSVSGINYFYHEADVLVDLLNEYPGVGDEPNAEKFKNTLEALNESGCPLD